MKTKIEWATDVWNPVTGCTKVSEGCRHCYAETIAKRFWGERKFADVQCHPERLEAPLHWKKPRRVFVNSMSDLFHPDVPWEFIDRVFAAINSSMTTQHTFMILTKRADRMEEYINSYQKSNGWYSRYDGMIKFGEWPLPNAWLGVTVENQKAADDRIPLLLKTPAVVRFVSVEPMLGSVDLLHVQYDNMVEINALTGDYGVYRPLQGHDYNKLDWVICGGETGPGARPMHPDWALSLLDQCSEASVPFFFKRWGEWLSINGIISRVGKEYAGRLLDGREWNEIPQAKR